MQQNTIIQMLSTLNEIKGQVADTLYHISQGASDQVMNEHLVPSAGTI